MNPTPHSQWSIPEADAGLRLDLCVARRLNVGRGWVRRLLQAGRIRLDGRTLTLNDKGRLLSPGGMMEITGGVADAPTPELEAPLSILARGDGWIILDKPPGQAVHPLRPGEGGTLLNALVARHPEITSIGEGGPRGGVVHRLDVQTSGAVLFATNPSRWRDFREAFAHHQTEKIYQALVHGHPPGQGERELYLYIAQHRPARVRVAPSEKLSRGARKCSLQWRVIKQFPHASQVEIQLGTGFLHQIRAMFAHMGHPVIADPLYGKPDADLAPRQMLHAQRLRVLEAEAVSPIPQDFQQTLEKLRCLTS